MRGSETSWEALELVKISGDWQLRDAERIFPLSSDVSPIAWILFSGQHPQGRRGFQGKILPSVHQNLEFLPENVCGTK